MHLDELLNKLESEGFFLIRVEGNALQSKEGELVFIGSLEDFLKASKALKAEAVFVINTMLHEDDFKYEADDEYDEDNNLSGDNQSVYLPSVMPALNKFKKYVGQDCAYKLFVTTGNNILAFFIRESWWDDFAQKYMEAISKWEETQQALRYSERVKLKAKQKEILDQVDSLINDAAFSKLPTQKAMIAYAIDKLPKLEEVDETDLQMKISNINARLQAKGLGTKR